MTRSRRSERVTLHFALGHLPEATGFQAAVSYRRFSVEAHTPESLGAHAAQNAALRALPPEARARFTHYAEVDVPSDMASLIRVAYPSQDPSRGLPDLAMLFTSIPLHARQKYWARRAAGAAPAGTAPPVPTQGSASSADVEIALDEHYLVTSNSTASTVLFHHPQLLTSDPDNAQIIMSDHINSTANQNNVERLAGIIAHQGKNWNALQNSVDHNGTVLEWGPGFSNTGPVQAYQLSSQTVTSLAAPLILPLSTTQSDPALQNSVWSTVPGAPSTPVSQTAQALAGTATGRAATVTRRRRAARAAPSAAGDVIDGYDFALTNRTPGYGLSIDESSLQFTSGSDPGTGTMSINVTNSYLRSLYAWVSFLDEDGSSLGAPTQVSLVTPVNVVLGIPMPTDPTTLTFDWPGTASTAVLQHGGLGTSNWDNDIVWPGVTTTGIFNYAIPALFIIAGILLEGDGELNAIEKNSAVQTALRDIGLSILGSTETNSIGFSSVKTILTALADGIAGFLVHKGLEALQEWVVEKVGETAFEDAVPLLDIVFQVANRAVDLIEIGETTVEVLLSPAVYTVQITRSMPVALQIGPDPTHGVWPENVDHYQAIIQYQGGSFFTATAAVSISGESNTVDVAFASVPAGGNLQGKFALYAADDTLLGQWSGPWVPAVPPADGTTLTLAGLIQEALVPLTADTVYQYEQKLVYDASSQAHLWQSNQFTLPSSEAANLDNNDIDQTVASAFLSNGITLSTSAVVDVKTAGSVWTIVDGASAYHLVTASSGAGSVIEVNTFNAPMAVLPLNPSDQGNNLGALVNITINDRAYMVGYTWEASGQGVPLIGSSSPINSQIYTFQNISVLDDPDSALKFSGCGFGNQPLLVYDQFGPEPLFTVASTDYETDLDDGTLDAGLCKLFTQFGYPLPDDATVAVVKSGAAWTISCGSTVTYQLDRLTDQINVYPYPTLIVSQNNFYIAPVPNGASSPSSYRYQLRQVTLDSSTPFPMTATSSYGQFLLPGLDAAAVHPQGYVIGAHADSSTLEVLQLPSTPASNAADAVAAVIVGGLGTRAGLFDGPTALTVTADGRVLVLEQGNQRIQAVDVNGNPVYCFTGAALATGVAASACSGLDQGLVSSGLRSAFAGADAPLSALWRIQDGTCIYQLAMNASATALVVTSAGNQLSDTWTITDSTTPTAQVFTCTLGSDAIGVTDASGNAVCSGSTDGAQTLNSGSVPGDIKAGLAAKGMALVNPLSVAGTGLTLPASDATTSLMAGTVPPDLAGLLSARGLTLSASATVSANVTVAVEASGSNWTLTDPAGPACYAVTLAGGAASIVSLTPFAPLKNASDGSLLIYSSIGTELKGYIYTLGYADSGTAPTDFLLDIYQPDGAFLSRTAGVNAGQMTVDFWRNVYTLNYESFLGPNGRTEPSISKWAPSV